MTEHVRYIFNGGGKDLSKLILNNFINFECKKLQLTLSNSNLKMNDFRSNFGYHIISYHIRNTEIFELERFNYIYIVTGLCITDCYRQNL